MRNIIKKLRLECACYRISIDCISLSNTTLIFTEIREETIDWNIYLLRGGAEISESYWPVRSCHHAGVIARVHVIFYVGAEIRRRLTDNCLYQKTNSHNQKHSCLCHCGEGMSLSEKKKTKMSSEYTRDQIIHSFPFLVLTF